MKFKTVILVSCLLLLFSGTIGLLSGCGNDEKVIVKSSSGTITYDDAEYTGELKDGIPHGQGTMNYPNGNVYSGNWYKGKKQGQGTMTYPNGNKYTGSWKKDIRIGQGTIYYSNGTKFEGEFKGDNPSYNGTWYDENGEIIKPK